MSAKLITAILGRYNIDFIFEDKFGVLTRRAPSDNIEYILETGNSCDAAPLMAALHAHGRFGTCFDVGANIGIVSAFLSSRSQAVYAFEPEPTNILRLRDTIKLNRCNNVTVCEMGVSKSSGQETLYVLDSYGHHSLGRVQTSRITRSIEIPITTIDEYCSRNHIPYIDLLKVDVEGFEQEVLEGASQMLAAKRIGLIAFEIARVPLASLGKSAETIFGILAANDYVVESLDGSPPPNTNLVEHCDLLAKPRR